MVATASVATDLEATALAGGTLVVTVVVISVAVTLAVGINRNFSEFLVGFPALNAYRRSCLYTDLYCN